MKLFGLIGYPLSHSFSAKYFADKFKSEGITDCAYNLFPLQNIELLPDLIRNNKDLAGLNVTIPYKETVISFLNSIDENINDIRAVNTIRIIREKDKTWLKGYNTDVYGFIESLKPFLNIKIKRALILGTGGASKAVAWALKNTGLEVICVSRNPVKADDISYKSLTPDIMAGHLLIVNTSPAGMFPETNTFPPIPYKYLTPDHVLFDLVYNPAETRFLALGKEKKATVVSGLQMLYLQADKSWEIWNSDHIIA